ncbi:MAG: hypothetical protein Q9195_008240 [Heterodermia aff. obscurata]
MQFASETGFKPPAITFMIPVYKESLPFCLAPTIRSLLSAVHRYELAGGEANIIIGDDGMQLISDTDRAARIRFYQDAGVSWVARPKHQPYSPTPYTRAGKFKGASNMNNVCQLAILIRDHLRKKRTSSGSNADNCSRQSTNEMMLYDEAITTHRTANWVGGDLRMGDILYVGDSDHRVPENFLLFMAAEFFLDPQLGILQFISDPYFISLSYGEFWAGWGKHIRDLMHISYAKAGTNSLSISESNNYAIRVDALAAIQYRNEDGELKFWSEVHVSERLDLNFRLLIAGYRSKLAQYPSIGGLDSFFQGVSLTIRDEIKWMEKEAYGTSELIFNPFRTWLWRGPFKPLIRALPMSNLTLAQKVDFYRSYMAPFTLASSLPIAIFHYFYVGFHSKPRESRYINCWWIFLAALAAWTFCVGIFIIVAWYSLILIQTGSNTIIVIARNQNRRKTGSSILQLALFAVTSLLVYTGTSLNFLYVIIFHLCEIDVTWGANYRVVRYCLRH